MKNDNYQKPIDRDDPRLTAYALGEGTAEDRAEIEAALAADASLAEQVESIRHTATLLTATLAAEPLPEVAVKVQAKKKWYQKQIAPIVFLTATACLLVMLILPALQPARECSRRLANQHDTQEAKSAAVPSTPPVIETKEQLKYGTMALNKREAAGKDKEPTDAYRVQPVPVSVKDQPASAYASSPSKSPPTSYTWGYSQNTSGWKKRTANEPYFEQGRDLRHVIVNAEETQTGRLMFGVGVNSDAGLVGNVVLDEKAKKGVAMGRETQSLQMMVTPSIIIQEEEEERLGTTSYGAKKEKTVTVGMSAPGVFSADLDVPFQVFGRKIEESPSTSPSRTKNTVILNRLSLSSEAIIDTAKIRESEARIRASEVFKENPPTGEPPKILIAPAEHNTEAYDQIVENEFLRTTDQPLSTFSIDVDTAGYSNLRRFLSDGSLPPKGAVRTEEMVNYFEYDYTPPTADDKTPFAANMAVAACPWNEKHELVRIALKGREVEEKNRPEMNLVFLLDVSGSMRDANKLPLVKQGMTKLVRQLDKHDHVAIVVYAGASGMVLPSTAADSDGKPKILAALDRLESGGSTNGGEGIRLAYATAAKNFNSEGVNRVILCTDGDFNVGTTSESELTELIEKKAKEDVFLTVLGFGCGNYKDSTLEKLADKGNGNYGYIDTLAEAEKLLVRQLLGTLVTIAKDVKIQVEFNPKKVAGYRLLGYENRVMAKEDFNDDTKDAGEIGAGHTVTAFYELIPAGSDETIGTPAVDPLKYQANSEEASSGEALKEIIEETDPANSELLTLKLRYKQPDGDTSTKIEFPLAVPEKLSKFSEADDDFRFASSVVGLAMLLRDSKYKGTVNFEELIDWAEGAKGADPHGYRKEFIQLLRTARSLSDQ